MTEPTPAAAQVLDSCGPYRARLAPSAGLPQAFDGGRSIAQHVTWATEPPLVNSTKLHGKIFQPELPGCRSASRARPPDPHKCPASQKNRSERPSWGLGTSLATLGRPA